MRYDELEHVVFKRRKYPPFLSLSETFSSLLIDSNGQGHSAQLSMALNTASNNLHLRGTLAVAPGTLSGKSVITLELARDRRILFTSNTIAAVDSDNVSTLTFCLYPS